MLLLIGGTRANTIPFNSAHTQMVTLGEPYFVEEGKVTGQKEICP
jgi:hypothetical protein